MSRGRQYDQAITIFSPEGRIYQVEYALELVKRGAPIVGLRTIEGAVLAAFETESNPLVFVDYSKKIFKIDEHVGAAISGLSPDARVLLRQARLLSQSNRLTYDEPIDIEVLTGELGDLLQMYTQNAGVRPFGVSMIIAGIDSRSIKVVSLDPSGSYRMYNANSVGRNSEEAKKILNDEYKPDLSIEEGISLAIRSINAAANQTLSEQLTVATISSETRRFRELSKEEISEYI